MRFRGFFVLTALLLALAAPAQAERATLDRILPEIRAAHPGRLSDAQPWIDENGHTHYRIKWVTREGRVLYFNADVRTGRISSSGGDDDERWRGDNGDNRRGGESGWPFGDPDARRRQNQEDERGGHRDNWNGERGGWPGGHWRDRGEDGDWRSGHNAGDNGGWHHRDHGGH